MHATESQNGPGFFNLRVLLWWMGGFLCFSLIALVVIFPTRFGQSAAMTIWAFGLCAIGAIVGFLFGIPRVLSKPGSTFAANTNLEQVSDWLTKIMVGVGLVELGQIPTQVNRLAEVMSPSFGGAPEGASVATGVILVFSAGGFLIGYITSRTFILQILRDAEEQTAIVLERRRQAIIAKQTTTTKDNGESSAE